MAADNAKMFFLSLLEAVICPFAKCTIVVAFGITHLLANCGTRLCGISSKRPWQQTSLRTRRLAMGWLTGVSSRLTMDLILFIDTWKGYIPEWGNCWVIYAPDSICSLIPAGVTFLNAETIGVIGIYPLKCAAKPRIRICSLIHNRGYIPEWGNYWG